VPLLLLSLHSSKVKVKQASIEALAIANQYLSESQATSTLLESLMLSQCDPETIKMLHRRFVRGQLPILGPDGSVEFRIGADGSIAEEFFDPSVSLNIIFKVLNTLKVADFQYPRSFTCTV
jgi:hypothetical protein